MIFQSFLCASVSLWFSSSFQSHAIRFKTLISFSSQRETDGKDRAAFAGIRGGERAAVFREDAVREREADPVPFRFGSKERKG